MTTAEEATGTSRLTRTGADAGTTSRTRQRPGRVVPPPRQEPKAPPSRPAPEPEVTRTVRVVRPADQVDVELQFVNLDVDPATQTLVPVDPQLPSWVRVLLGSQHTVEEVSSRVSPAPSGAVDHRGAAPSWLVLDRSGGPYTVDALLDLAGAALVLDERAGSQPPGPGGPTGEPGDDVTSLEVPEGLVLSPVAPFRFTAHTRPISAGDVTEVWTARLGRDGAMPLVRAIWNRSGDDFTRPIDSDTRDLLVDASAGMGNAIEVDRLWLSSHGASARLRGAWESGDLASYWHHIATGRDVHVEAVLRGYLAPFGHRATIATVSERVLARDAEGELVAHVVQADYLAIAEATVENPATCAPDDGRGLPLTAVTVVSTDPVRVGKAPVPLPSGEIDPDKAWLVTDADTGDDLRVAFTGTDRAGVDDIGFTLPLVFVTESFAYHVQDEVNGVPTALGNLATFYAETATDERREIELGGRPIAWADGSGPAGAVKPTDRIRLRLWRPDLDALGLTPTEARELLEDAGQPAFGPVVDRAWVVDEATAGLFAGPGSTAPPEIEVEPSASWLEHGTDAANLDLSFLSVVEVEPPEPAFEGQGTSLVRPALKVDTFSQGLGSGIDLSGGEWNPASALADAAKLFGVVTLSEIVGAIDDLQGGLDVPGLPRFEVVTVPGDGPLDPPKAICQQMVWEPALKSWPSGGSPVLIVADDLAKNGLPTPFDQPSATRVFLETCVHFDGAAPTTEVDVRIDRVAIQLPPLVPGVALLFNELRYNQPPEGPGQVTTRLEDWLFVGFLEWLEPIRQFVLELLDLAEVEISDAGIFISCQIPVPSLSFGVVGVTDLDVGLDLDLPSDDPSQIRFGLSERADPFAITVFGFGGTGSFELLLAADRIVFLEGSLAVTYELSVDIVIASASLSASLGVAVTLVEEQVELAAYVELRGSVGILGLVDITGSVVLALIYGLQTKLLRGVATVTGEVDSIFGKSDVSFETEVEVPLAGGASARALAAVAVDVTAAALSFADRFSTDEWTEYCDAYASSP